MRPVAESMLAPPNPRPRRPGRPRSRRPTPLGGVRTATKGRQFAP
jgi:hypothetical protein